jgi:peptide-methionine (S)-S-oxide reductase
MSSRYSANLVTLGGGCFWCLEAFYSRVHGVSLVTSGYSGGYIKHPTAEQVYRGNTGHAEVIQFVFDSKVISYRKLLEIFYVMHDPTTLNAQGNDVGEEYRSIIFYHSNSQKTVAEDVTKNFAAVQYENPVVTQIVPFQKFWPAEEYNQNFYDRNPNTGYCQAIITPKLAKLRREFAKLLVSNS